METVTADLIIEINVECPSCEHCFNLLTDTDLNDEGDLLNQTITDARWEIDADERLKCSPVCPQCSVQFEVKGVHW